MRRAFMAVIVAAVLLLSGAAQAVFKVAFTVETMYKASAQGVVVGKIARVSPENAVVLVTVTDTLKGPSPGGQIRLQVLAPDGLINRLSPDQPVVLFAGVKQTLVHLGDTWTLAEKVADAQPPTWRIADEKADARLPFPGRTATLVQILAEVKAGKSTLLNEVDDKVFRGDVKPRGTLPVQGATFLVAADVNGDHQPDLLVGTAAGVSLFLAAGTGYDDVTEKWGLKGVSAPAAAFADVDGDGKPDLLLGKTLWHNDGGKFVALAGGPVLPDDPAIVAAALVDTAGAGHPDALLLRRNGGLLSFANPGAPGKPWAARPVVALWKDGEPATAAVFGHFGTGAQSRALVLRGGAVFAYGLDGQGPADDYLRLTGVALGAVHKPGTPAPRFAHLVAVDATGDGRPDCLLAAPGLVELLVNRGFGAFAATAAVSAILCPDGKPAPVPADPGAVWAAADLHGDKFEDLLVLTGDGRLFEVDNPPYAAHP